MAETKTVDVQSTPVDKEIDNTPAANDIKPTDNRSKERNLEQAYDDLGQAREANAGYAEAGPFYASKAPVANAIGGELGVVTRDDKTGTVQRTGIGLYIRSDHFFGHTYEAMKTI